MYVSWHNCMYVADEWNALSDLFSLMWNCKSGELLENASWCGSTTQNQTLLWWTVLSARWAPPYYALTVRDYFNQAFHSVASEYIAALNGHHIHLQVWDAFIEIHRDRRMRPNVCRSQCSAEVWSMVQSQRRIIWSSEKLNIVYSKIYININMIFWKKIYIKYLST